MSRPMHSRRPRRAFRPLSLLLVMLALFALLVPALASAGDGQRRRGDHAERHDDDGPQLDDATRASLDALRSWTRGHVTLAHHYLANGDPASAAAHLDTVLGVKLDPAFEATLEAHREARKAAREADGVLAGDDDAKKGKKGKKGRRGKGKMERKQLMLYVMAARAHSLAGDNDTALQRLDEGIARATELGADKMVEKLQALRDAPDKLASDDFGGKKGKKWAKHHDGEVDVATVEAEIREAEKGLPLAP